MLSFLFLNEEKISKDRVLMANHGGRKQTSFEEMGEKYKYYLIELLWISLNGLSTC